MKHFLLITAITLSVLWPGPALSGDTLRINTSIKPPFSTHNETGFFDLIIKELGKRIDLKVELVRLPPERALYSVNEGISNGELPRIAGLQKEYPNLIQIEEKIIDYNFVAFSKNASSVTSWEDLADKRVGYLHGWKIFDNNVPESAHKSKPNNPSSLIDMLDEGRIDVALYERYAGWKMIRTHGHSRVKECPQPLAVKPMYLYLNKGCKWLVPAVTETLREMKKDGTYERIAKQTLDQQT